jgi:signal transduction histidine kinase
MEPLAQNIRLVKRAYWLIRLRWMATVFVVLATFFSYNILSITLEVFSLYSIAILLALYNIIIFLLLNHYTKVNGEVPYRSIKKIINFQISADLLLLAILLHFSGGIENPFIFYFIFHMIIASILLSVKESYLQCTFAVLFFGLLILLEYMQLIDHYCLQGFVERCLHRDGFFVLGTYFVFTTAMYLVVYMASYIATRLRRAEQSRREANILLQEKDHIKDEYVLRLTHDIKGHLAAIQSCLDVVVHKKDNSFDEKKPHFIDRAHNRTKQVTHFVKTLLRLTQMRLSNNFEMEIFSLENTIKNSVLEVENKASDKSIELRTNVELAGDKVFGDRFSIEEMVTNLLLNAIKYTTANGIVEVSVKENGESFLVEVSDTGIGIPHNELPRVFDEFYRASNARKYERDGTGLGLPIVKQIIERHNGKIWVESEEKCGSKFYFTLPKGSINVK